MTARPPYRVAVIADAHFHDIHGDYGTDRAATHGLVLRPMAQVARSPRLFNEAGFALTQALQQIATRGITEVILLGDYSDDGQAVTLTGLRAVLEQATARFGLRFFGLPGNHDVFADTGRHRSKRFLNASGGYDLVTSNPTAQDAAAGRVIVTPQMRCSGVEAGLRAMPAMGVFADGRGLHWETPFGPDPDPAQRRYRVTSADGTVTRWLMDASFLIEPVPGVWLLLLDANVWVPFGQSDGAGHDEDYADSTLAGWNAVLAHKPFLLDWMAGVVRRARHLGKTLLTFSHYPVLDAFADCRAAEVALMGHKGLTGRMPGPAVARAVAATGVGLHVSGHLHLNATLRAGGLVNIAMPSLVAYPAAFKVLTVQEDRVAVETISLHDMPIPEVLQMAYRREADQTGKGVERLLRCSTYGDLVAEHAGHLVTRRHLRREWPADLAAILAKASLGDLAAMAGGQSGMPDVPAVTLLEDWYRLRMGSEFGLDLMSPERLQAYRRMSALHAATPTPLSAVFAILDSVLARLPARNFTVDLATGHISPRQPQFGLA